MKILDLFCGAGGASMGLHRAFPDAHIVGVDINPQPRYPFDFVQADALEFPLDDYDFFWASPPCQIHSCMTKGRHKNKLRFHVNLIPAIRNRLIGQNKPYIIENVPGAKEELKNPIMLCGSMFKLETKHGSQLRRHRLFECSFNFSVGLNCNHVKGENVIGVYGGRQHPQRRKIPKTIGVYGHAGGSSKRDYLSNCCFTVQDRRDAMDIGWMTGSELAQSIPPAYSEYIGNQFKGQND